MFETVDARTVAQTDGRTDAGSMGILAYPVSLWLK